MYKLLTILLFLLLSLNAYGRGTLIFQDTFTGTNGTALTAHTPDVGTSWTNNNTCTNALNIQSNAASQTTIETDCIRMAVASPAPTTPDVDVQVTFTDGGAPSATTCRGVVFRYQDSSNYYSLGVCDDSGQAYRLYSTVSGTPSSIATGGAFGNGNTDVIVVKAREGYIDVFENGTRVIHASDNSITSAGQTGVWQGAVQVSTDDTSGTIPLDNFNVIQMPKRMIGE